jgi:SagB-type dehydrogenase family enzyme
MTTVHHPLLLLALALSPAAAPEEAAVKPAGRAVIELPRPMTDEGPTLAAALARRESVRRFDRRALTELELGQLAWAAQGVNRRAGGRTAPSAGALYPLELYVALPEGLYHYEPRAHRLVRTLAGDPRPALHAAALEQGSVLDAPAVFVIAAVESRTAAKYGQRAHRYALIEVGHAAQNLLLTATALGLGGVPVGAFDDQRLHDALRLGDDEAVYYLLPVGQPD